MVVHVSATRHPGRGAGFELVVVVTSLGGFATVPALLAGLPADFATPVMVLQHGAAPTSRSSQGLAGIWQRHTALPVSGATGGTLAGPGIRVLPGGYTARFGPSDEVELDRADRLGGGDALLTSAAEKFGPAVIAVVLTGRLYDGAEGVRAVKRRGGRVLAQDPVTAVAASMPRAAIATGCVDFVLSPPRIAVALIALTMAHGAAELLTVPTPHWAQLSN